MDQIKYHRTSEEIFKNVNKNIHSIRYSILYVNFFSYDLTGAFNNVQHKGNEANLEILDLQIW